MQLIESNLVKKQLNLIMISNIYNKVITTHIKIHEKLIRINDRIKSKYDNIL